MAANGLGRESKLKPLLARKIYRHLVNGNSVRGTCNLVGISQPTFDRWSNLGKKHDAECELELKQCVLERHELAADRGFFIHNKKAREIHIDWHVKNINRHAKKEWTASAWKLERTVKDEYGKNATIQHTGSIDHNHTHQLATVTPQQKLRIADALKLQAAIDMAETDSGTFEPVLIEGNTETQD